MWDKIVEPKDDGLRATADIIRQNVEAGVDTYVNVNNHYEGCPASTLTLRPSEAYCALVPSVRGLYPDLDLNPICA